MERRQYMILIDCPTRQFLLLFISSLIDICTPIALYLLLLLFVMCEIEWWNNALCLPYPTPQVDKMTDKTKRQKNKKTRRKKTERQQDKKSARQKDSKTGRQKQIRWWNNAFLTQPQVDKMTDKPKDKRRKGRKTKRQKDRNRYDGETMQNAHLTQP